MTSRKTVFVLSCIATSVFAFSTSTDLTPISRVVELLRGLRTQTEQDMNTEEKLYEKFVCWGKTVINTKTASNLDAKRRIQELETYIADIEAGRVEFTSERKNLEKDMAAVLLSMEEAQALRKREHDEFLDAEDELIKAKAALEKAMTVLKEATEGHATGVLLQNKAASDGVAVRSAEAAELMQAVHLGEKILNTGDATFLRRLLIADVPNVDWKKLNRKATFKLGYKARSFKIQGVLGELYSTMNSSLVDAQEKEADAESQFTKLMQSKGNEKAQTQEALDKMEEENGARGMSKQEAQTEVDALSQQVEDDSKYIQQTQTSLAEKKTEWVDRKNLRAGELAAMSKAIAILSNDDARDLFKRSLKSQGYSFLQASQEQRAAQSAASILRKTVATISGRGTVGGMGLAVLAARLKGVDSTHFTEVIAAIDRMVSDLKKEENIDLEKKENCEKTRQEDTRAVALASRNMDERTEEIERLDSEIQEINADMARKNESIAQIQTQLDEATENRESENAEFLKSAKDDEEAKTTVERAKDVLSAFYADNNLMLVQEAPAAGEAPARPPDTWEGPYEGQTEESTSILAILSMIVENIVKDISDTKAAEEKSAAEYSEFKTDSEAQILALETAITDLDSSKAGKEGEKKSAGDTRLLKRDELDVVMKKIADAQPGCDFVTINYPMRLENRRIELDGLTKAKAILTGGDFSRPDPKREIKPGDAFLAVSSSM